MQLHPVVARLITTADGEPVVLPPLPSLPVLSHHIKDEVGSCSPFFPHTPRVGEGQQPPTPCQPSHPRKVSREFFLHPNKDMTGNYDSENIV